MFLGWVETSLGKSGKEVHMLWGRRDRSIPLWRGKMRPAAVAVNKVHQNTWLPVPGHPRTSGSLRLHINKTMLFFSVVNLQKLAQTGLGTLLPGTYHTHDYPDPRMTLNPATCINNIYICIHSNWYTHICTSIIFITPIFNRSVLIIYIYITYSLNNSLHCIPH